MNGEKTGGMTNMPLDKAQIGGSDMPGKHGWRQGAGQVAFSRKPPIISIQGNANCPIDMHDVLGRLLQPPTRNDMIVGSKPGYAWMKWTPSIASWFSFQTFAKHHNDVELLSQELWAVCRRHCVKVKDFSRIFKVSNVSKYTCIACTQLLQ